MPVELIPMNRTTFRTPSWHGLSFRLLLTLFALPPTLCFAHSRPVHMLISSNAALSSVNLQAFLADYFGAQGASSLYAPPLWLYGFPDRGDNNTFSPMEWIRWGSYDEDDAVSVRSADHFYT